MNYWRQLERLAWTAGILSVGIWCAGWTLRTVGARAELNRFAVLRTNAGLTAAPPDLSLWSDLRIRMWRQAQSEKTPEPRGVLRIARLGLEVPILDGTDDVTLDRGVGHIDDTASLTGSGVLSGNIGLAGHRDGFFRVLKDIAQGDTVEVETLTGTTSFRVEQSWIVQPEDVWVLDPTPEPSLTLVTCYPFYFVGAAPQRFIVRAVSASKSSTTAGKTPASAGR